jgi:hypothetical protein
MTDNVHIEHELLVSYLYDECEPAERVTIAAHLTACADCGSELASLTTTRALLADWTPPDVALGFQIPRSAAAAGTETLVAGHERARLFPHAAAPGARDSWWARPLPAWAQAAAAAVIFAAGLAVGASRDAGGADVPATATVQEAAATGTPAPAADPAAASSDALALRAASVDELSRQVEQLRTELATFRAAAAPARAAAPPANAELLSRAQELIDESAAGLRSELTLRTTQLARDFEIQRRQDLLQVNQSIDRVNGQAGAAAREQRQAIEGLAKVVGLSVTPAR